MKPISEKPDGCRHLEAWLDGQLSELDAEQFELHLVQCPQCCQRADSIQQLDLEVEAACRLFANQSGPVPAITGITNPPSSPRSIDTGRARNSLLATIAMIAAGILAVIWFTWPPSGPDHANDQVQSAENSSHSEISSKLSQPAVQFAIHGDALAEPAITTERFTFVRVMAVTSVTPNPE